MKILVTGGAGFIGSQLCESLVQRGDDVTCIDNFNDYYSPKIKRKNIELLLQNEHFSLEEIDIRNYDELNRIFSKYSFDSIVHLAARAGVRPSIKQPILYQEVNIQGTQNLLEMARNYQISNFIFASSSSVYGNNKRIPFSETDNVDFPVSPYAATKKSGELIAYTYHNLYDISIYCIRFFTVYGPRQRPDMAIHKFTRLIDKGEPIPVFGDGSSKRDYTYISDIIEGVRNAVDTCSGYEIFNLGDSRTVSLMEMIQTIEKHLGKKANLTYLPFQPGDVEITYADISKAQEKLRYSPHVYFDEGIERFIDWYKTIGRELK